MDTTKLNASIARFKAHTLELKAKRRAIIRIDDPPKPQESVPKEKGRRVLEAACRCQAKTMEGKQCGFKAVVGTFCKKHAIKT
jgi:hypothetical protein